MKRKAKPRIRLPRNYKKSVRRVLRARREYVRRHLKMIKARDNLITAEIAHAVMMERFRARKKKG